MTSNIIYSPSEKGTLIPTFIPSDATTTKVSTFSRKCDTDIVQILGHEEIVNSEARFNVLTRIRAMREMIKSGDRPSVEFPALGSNEIADRDEMFWFKVTHNSLKD